MTEKLFTGTLNHNQKKKKKQSLEKLDTGVAAKNFRLYMCKLVFCSLNAVLKVLEYISTSAWNK